MKKIIMSAVLSLMLLVLSMPLFAENSVSVYVTIANGELVMAQNQITVTDIDNDGELTINDALYLAHKAAYDGGAESGYASEKSDYGVSLTKLWGVENGGGYGYYKNNSAASGLTDSLNEGDYISAFVYTDTVAFSDVYCYFNVNNITVAAGDASEITLKLLSAGYDDSWNPVVLPVNGAEILVDGKETGFITDETGTATITLDISKNSIISAKSDLATLVPPVCEVIVETSESVESTNIEEASGAGGIEEQEKIEMPILAPQTDDSVFTDYVTAFVLMGIAAFAMILVYKKSVYEK